jgi:hypothetical protein
LALTFTSLWRTFTYPKGSFTAYVTKFIAIVTPEKDHKIYYCHYCIDKVSN